MPIHINLLAEDLAAEDMRRRDPARRAMLVAAAVVGAFVLWGGWLYYLVNRGETRLASHQAQWAVLEKEFNRVTENLRRTADVERKLDALDQLAANRFLWGNALNALQQSAMDDIQLVRLRTEQTYVLTEAVRPKTNSVGTATTKPASSAEKISIRLSAKDHGSPPGQQVNRFKEAIATFPYFKENLKQVDGVRLTELSPPQTDANDPTRSFVLFGLECRYPEKVRTK